MSNLNSLTIEDLKKQRRWVLWRLETRDGKETKVPYQANGKRADSTNPASWQIHEEVSAHRHKFDGVGIVLGEVDGIRVSGVDIDKCYDREAKLFTPESRDYVIGLDSYTEFSPSGDGVHILVLGDLRGRTGAKEPVPGCKAIELYDSARYLTFTGRHVGKTPANLLDRADELNELYNRVKAAKLKKTGLTVSISLSEEDRFQKLMAGDTSDYDNDHSKADFALCVILAKKHRCDAFKIDEAFRESGLYREKWERDYYRGSTITRAVLAVAKESVVVFEQSDTMDEDGETEFLVEPNDGAEGWFPKGEVSLIGGSSGVGKTSFVMPMLEKIRRGEEVFGHKTKPREYRVVLHDRSKKATRRTIKALGLTEESATRLVPLSLSQKSADIGEVLQAAIEEHPGAEAWFIEGLDLWIPDMNKAAVVQAVLSSIIAVAQKYNVAVLGSVGAPKQKGPDRYHGRDVLFGSAALARKTETIVALSYHDEKDLKSPRVCWVMPRNSSPEKMFFDWVDGRFTQVEEPEDSGTNSDVGSPALLKMHAQIRSIFGDGTPIRYTRALGAEKTYYRWRDWAVARGSVVRTDGNYYLSASELQSGLTAA
ncbi:phage NrS-1 polymerase family protein [Edaphobacter albus]|uniref:phage NrS-1 polymerase family protein n=1 Tax=Edaphobacter sp. 4G125 TaxID=2763071 RepID=UPI0016492A84|nr:AAA family ATPase [Edaphobacter sp. 4G125]QNI35452.1 AAA family ATPase [Edaphobacter sp. 4G125]